MKYVFIRAHQTEFQITRLCHALQISRSGFYAWQRRPESRRPQHNRLLLARMQVLHQETREAYGARKMWQCLRQEGLACGRHRVARLRPWRGWSRNADIALSARLKPVERKSLGPTALNSRLQSQSKIASGVET